MDISKALAILCTFILLSILNTNLYAQESGNSASEKKFNHEIGLRAGLVTGQGLSYGIWHKRMGLEVAVLPYSSTNRFNLTIGGAILSVLKEHEKVNLLGFIGSSYSLMQYSNNTSSNYLNAGLGFGLQVIIFEVISMQLLAGYGAFDMVNNFSSSITAEAGIYYRL
ncbi:MAG: hypothetical protein IIA45_10300 [Bacteroidetes bacterium]|nr:hypothetical protein [Bacteroidota bacterium]